jgi:beta-glucosidase
VILRARVAGTGPIELGVLGRGEWTVRNGEQTLQFQVRSAGAGFGDDVLAPPASAQVVTVNDTGLVEAELTLDEPDGPMGGVAIAGLIAHPAPREADDVIAEAVAAASAAEVAVVVVGLTEEQETEAVDKSTLRLPGRQDDLVRAVAAAATRTVVVVNAATPVIMPWLEDVDAVLWAGLPGQEGGHAVAAALLGTIEPAGRLVTTFPADDAATPAWSVTPVDGAVIYAEGTFIGYRGHRAGRAPEPAFWLGHGLGYSTWEYAGAGLLDGAGASPRVQVSVTNTGTRTSRDVVQVYFRPVEDDQPIRLVGWGAVTVAAGQTATVEVDTDARLWRRWDADAGGWASLAAGGHLLIARGLGDVRVSIDLAAS